MFNNYAMITRNKEIKKKTVIQLTLSTDEANLDEK